MGIYDVPATELIEEIAKDFKSRLEKPEWTDYVKTGQNRERVPLRRDWWYVRLASVLYRVYTDGPLGVESLRTYYGGRKRRGVKPEHFKKASGKIVRVCLQILEKEGLIKKEKNGRGISARGQSYLSKKAKEVGEKLTHKKIKERELKLEAEAEKKVEGREVKEELKKIEEKEKRKEKAEEKKRKEKHKEPKAGEGVAKNE